MQLQTVKYIAAAFFLLAVTTGSPLSFVGLKKEYRQNEVFKWSVKNLTRKEFIVRAELESYSDAHWIKLMPNISGSCESCIVDLVVLPKQLLSVNYSLAPLRRKYFKNNKLPARIKISYFERSDQVSEFSYLYSNPFVIDIK